MSDQEKKWQTAEEVQQSSGKKLDKAIIAAARGMWQAN